MSFEAISGTVGAFGAFMPVNVVAMRHYDPNDSVKETDVRIGMILAVVWSFVIAAHYADKNNSARPFIYWIAAVSVMLSMYEFAFQFQPPSKSHADEN